MDPFHHLTAYTNPYAHLLPPSPSPPPPPPLPAAAEPPDRDRERLPQWGHDETAIFLSIRAELDDTFLATKRNKALWEAISTRLLADGFHRTPDQCKSKWKNLVTRFKGSEAMSEQEARRHFPFHEEMRRIFAARVERAHALEKKKGKEVQPEDDDGEGEEDEEEEDGDEEAEESKGVATGASGMRRNKKKKKRKVAGAGEGEVEGMLREFMRRQLEMEERWMEAAEAREAERRAREAEWRRAMVALGQERLALVRRWREREEAWRARAEAREERRHQLVAALLAKLGQD